MVAVYHVVLFTNLVNLYAQSLL